jgi:hypothetical protein
VTTKQAYRFVFSVGLMLAGAVILSGCGAATQPHEVGACLQGRELASEMHFSSEVARAGEPVGICNVTRRTVPGTYRLFVVSLTDAQRFGDAHGIADLKPARALGESAVELRPMGSAGSGISVRWPQLPKGRYTLAYLCEKCGNLMRTVWPNMVARDGKTDRLIVTAR